MVVSGDSELNLNVAGEIGLLGRSSCLHHFCEKIRYDNFI